MKNQSTRKLEKDLLKLHTKDFTDKDKLTVLHLILDGKIADAKDMLKPQGVPEKEVDNIIQEYKKNNATIQPAIPHTTSSQFHFPLRYKSNTSLIRVAINPDHIINEKNIAKVVKTNDQRKCNCRAILKYLRSIFDDFVING